MTHGQNLLVCRSVRDGYCYLPGGHVEPGESFAQALTRELIEEAGIDAEVSVPAFVSEERFEQGGRPRHEVNVVCHVALRGIGRSLTPPHFKSLEPAIAFEWIDLASLPELDFRPRSIKAWLMSGGQNQPWDR